MKQQQKQQEVKKKRKRKSKKINENIHVIIFPTILASLKNLATSNFAKNLLTKQLTKLHKPHHLKTLTTTNNFNLFLSLLPPLLTTPSIATKTAEIVGALCLESFEMNERVACDEEVLKGLLEGVGFGSKSVALAACNAVLDVCTTSVGRERFCELHAVEKLMSVFLQDAILPANFVYLCSMGRGSSKCPGGEVKENAFRVLILEATVTLINTCNVKQLSGIPEELSATILSYLKAFLVQVQNQRSQSDFTNCSQKRHSCLSIVKLHDLTQSIFRLSIKSGNTTTCISDKVKKSIFGPNQSVFEHFIFNYWENSPFVLRKLLEPLSGPQDSLNSFIQSFNSKGIHDVLSSTIEGLVSCPPLPSDELDILNFLKENKDGLGHQIIYGQDIRVVKAVERSLGTSRGNLKTEVHFLKECTGPSCISDPNFINIQKCEEAYREGYSIALRGMEFRSQSIASIANALAVLFGQPSVGANSYLTPPRSQGLARHYDDHCVFVCQILGQKKWNVYPQSTVHLPRLYEPLDRNIGFEGDNLESECKQFLLGEGDILYIPRGCPHEACTISDDSGSEMNDASSGFSFHLTLGIEIEPPFEWEGFAHVALHCWNQNKKQQLYTPVGPFSETLNLISINLLHVAIQQIGVLDPTFAKACMVVAFTSVSDAQDKNLSNTLSQNQRTTFNYVISKVDRDARFLEVFKSVRVAVEKKNEDMFQRMRWLRHLYPKESIKGGLHWENPLTEFENIILLYNEHREDAESAFMQVKSNFCREVVFEDACESFGTLLHKYKRVRTQYMNGMLSLHCNGKCY